MTGWHTYGMLAFHLYRWNQLEVIPLACRAHTRSVLSNATSRLIYTLKLECEPMPNVMAALPNIGGALCSMPQSLADAHYQSAVQ